jgi:hypothetical protein
VHIRGHPWLHSLLPLLWPAVFVCILGVLGNSAGPLLLQQERARRLVARPAARWHVDISPDKMMAKEKDRGVEHHAAAADV